MKLVCRHRSEETDLSSVTTMTWSRKMSVLFHFFFKINFTENLPKYPRYMSFKLCNTYKIGTEMDIMFVDFLKKMV